MGEGFVFCFMSDVVSVLEIIGTVAFAISGSMTAIRNRLDLFGIVALGVLTATGGGILRDIILGIFPPTAFVHPIYVATAALVSIVVFLIMKDQYNSGRIFDKETFRLILLLGDSIGLGIFTTVGMRTAIMQYTAENGFLCVFSGVITGVGGGLLRDVVIHQFPDIFTKHIYAIASVIGAIVALFLFQMNLEFLAVHLGAVIVSFIRLLAAHYKWSLPRI